MKVSTVFHYFLDGVYLTDGTPFVEWMECLGVGVVDLLALSVVAGGVTLPIGVTGNTDSTFIRLKESEECAQNFPSEFHG